MANKENEAPAEASEDKAPAEASEDKAPAEQKAPASDDKPAKAPRAAEAQPPSAVKEGKRWFLTALLVFTLLAIGIVLYLVKYRPTEFFYVLF